MNNQQSNPNTDSSLIPYLPPPLYLAISMVLMTQQIPTYLSTRPAIVSADTIERLKLFQFPNQEPKIPNVLLKTNPTWINNPLQTKPINYPPGLDHPNIQDN